MKKRMLSLILALTMIGSMLVPMHVSAALFSDVNGHWAQATIEELAGKGIINGKEDGRYDPNGQVTRAEFTKLLMCIAGSDYTAEDGELKDVPETAWYNPYIYASLARSVFTLNEINDDNFQPEGAADRETVAVWAVRLLGIEGEQTSTPFADNSAISNKTGVATAYNNGIIEGDNGNFRPKDTLTRAEAATIIKRVMDKYAEMNTVRESKNTVDYKDGLNEISASKEENILLSVDEEKGIFVFDKINDEIRALKTGDLFVIKPCETIPTGVAIKVKSITINGDKATITQGDIKLEDVIDDLDMATQIPVSSDYIIEGSLGEGVTLSNDSSYMADAGDNLLASNDGFGDKFKLSFNIDYSVSDNLTISGNVSMSDFVITPDISGNKASNLKIKLTESHNESISVGVSGSKKWDMLKTKDTPGYTKKYHKDGFTEGQYTPGLKKDRNALKDEIYNLWKSELGKSRGDLIKDKQFKKDIKLASFNIPTPVAGLFVIFDVKFNLDSKLEGSATISNVRTVTRGFEYSSGSGVNKISKCNNIESDLEIAGEFDTRAGVALHGGVTYLYIVTVEVGIEGGIGFSASTSLNAKAGYDFDSNQLNLSASVPFMGSITSTVEKGVTRVNEVHTCDICVDSVLYGYLSIDLNAKLGYGIVEITLFNPKWDILNKNNAKIATGYLYFDHDSDPFRGEGFGKCPNKYTTPVIQEQSESKKKEVGSDMSLFVRTKSQSIAERAKDQGIFTNKSSALIYQWYKDDIMIDGANSDTYQIASISENDFGTYKCIVALKDYPSIYTISDGIEISKEEDQKTDQKQGNGNADTKVSNYSGSVSENNSKSTFTFCPSATGTYKFENISGKKVLININGSYKSNEGEYELVGGQVYTVSIEWGVEDTNYTIQITGPITY